MHTKNAPQVTHSKEVSERETAKNAYPYPLPGILFYLYSPFRTLEAVAG